MAIQLLGLSPAMFTPSESETVPQARLETNLKIWLKVSAIVVLLLAMYANVLAALAYNWWTDDRASYGMLIPPFALYIAWLARKSTLAAPAATDRRGLILLALSCLTFLLGKTAAEVFTLRSSFVIMLAGLVWAFWGVHRLRKLAFPLLLLETMVPIPSLIHGTITLPLQLFASRVATTLLQMIGFSIFRDGNVIYLPNTSLGVAEACSGLRSLSSLVVGALVLGYLLCNRVRTRVALVVLAVPLAIGVNVARVTGTAIMADYNQEWAMGFYHSFSGWLVFVAGFGSVWLVAKGLHRIWD
jgi:exosortase